jgi:hypothetical protein
MKSTKPSVVDTVLIKDFMTKIPYFRERNSVRAGSQRLCGIVLFSILFAATTYADTFTFSTSPASGNLSAAAGSTVGWGYSVTNNSLDQWLIFVSLGSPDSFSNGTLKFDVFDYPIIAPNSMLTRNYDGTNGLFEFAWDAGVPAGSSNSGTLVLSAEWWSGDPFDEIAPGEFLETAPEFTLPYSVTVPVSCNCTPVPETSSLKLLAFGVGGLLLFSLTRKNIC